MVIRSQTGCQTSAFCQKQPLLHRKVLFQYSNLLLDIGHGILYTLAGNDPHGVHRCDEVVVGLSKLSILSRIARCPIKLLGVQLNPQGVCRSITGHDIPSLKTIDDDDRQNNGGNHCPDQLQTVIVREEGGLAVLVVSILPSKHEKEGVHQKEHRRDDPNIEAHQPIQLNTVFRSRWWSIIPVYDIQVNNRSKESEHEHQPEVRIQTGVSMRNVLFATP